MKKGHHKLSKNEPEKKGGARTPLQTMYLQPCQNIYTVKHMSNKYLLQDFNVFGHSCELFLQKCSSIDVWNGSKYISADVRDFCAAS